MKKSSALPDPMTSTPMKKGQPVTQTTTTYLLSDPPGFSSMELVQAFQRIGHTDEQAMRWFLRFAQRDLSANSAGDWSNLEYELTAYRWFGIPDAKGVWSGIKGVGIDSSSEYPDVEKIETVLLRREEITSFQSLTKRAFDAICKKQPLVFQFPSLKRTLSFNPSLELHLIIGTEPHTNRKLLGAGIPESHYSGWVERSSSENPGEVLTYLLLDLLKEHAARIKQCPEFKHKNCQRLFLADRKNKDFCSTKCQSRAGTRRYRVEHGMISGRPRGRPRKASSIGSKRLKPMPANARTRRSAHGKKRR